MINNLDRLNDLLYFSVAFRTFVLVFDPILLAALAYSVGTWREQSGISDQILAHEADKDIIQVGFQLHIMLNQFHAQLILVNQFLDPLLLHFNINLRAISSKLLSESFVILIELVQLFELGIETLFLSSVVSLDVSVVFPQLSQVFLKLSIFSSCMP